VRIGLHLVKDMCGYPATGIKKDAVTIGCRVIGEEYSTNKRYLMPLHYVVAFFFAMNVAQLILYRDALADCVCRQMQATKDISSL
jgi:hypothetical protein